MALLLGCLVRDEETNRATVLRQLTSPFQHQILSRIALALSPYPTLSPSLMANDTMVDTNAAHNFDDLITRIGYFIAHQLDNGVLSREAHRSYVEILEVHILLSLRYLFQRSALGYGAMTWH